MGPLQYQARFNLPRIDGEGLGVAGARNLASTAQKPRLTEAEIQKHLELTSPAFATFGVLCASVAKLFLRNDRFAEKCKPHGGDRLPCLHSLQAWAEIAEMAARLRS